MSATKILFVDDEVSLVQVIQDYLTDEGFEVEVAFSGNEGLTKAVTNKYDLIISDVKMSDGDGLKFLQGLSLAFPEKLPLFVFMSGFADMDEAQAKKLGALGLWQKPLLLSSLKKKILELLA